MDNSRISIAVLEGDKRQDILFDLLLQEGFNMMRIPAFAGELIIGSTPCPRNGLDFTSLFENMRFGGCRLFASGGISPEIQSLAEKNGIRTVDFMQLNDVAVKNAVPTAEGAIQSAMEHSDITLSGSLCLVTGWGRCGKILAQKLKGIGADVTVSARKDADMAEISASGFKFMHTNRIIPLNFDFI